MRLHRSDFILPMNNHRGRTICSWEGSEAVYYGKQSAMQWRTEEVSYFLNFLSEIQVDAVIIQDLGVLHLIRKMGIPLPIHISTMMNIHNIESALTMKETGCKTRRSSRDISLAQVKEIQEKTGIEVEYFVHGDLYVCQSGQCYASGMLFGKSANRGECMKPCRWNYTLVESISTTDRRPAFRIFTGHKGHNASCRHLLTLIHAGSVFKIEGRMRHADFLKEVVSIYRKAIDTYLDNPATYYLNSMEYEQLYNHRVRELYTSLYKLTPASAPLVDISGSQNPSFSRAAKE